MIKKKIAVHAIAGAMKTNDAIISNNFNKVYSEHIKIMKVPFCF